MEIKEENIDIFQIKNILFEMSVLLKRNQKNKILLCQEDLKPALGGHEQLASKHLTQPCQQNYSSSVNSVLHLILNSLEYFQLEDRKTLCFNLLLTVLL